MKKIRLIYFEGCPNLEKIKDGLRSIPGLKVDEIRQNVLPKSHPLRKYSSPTLLLGDEIIYGTQTQSSSGACSTEEVNVGEIHRRLMAHHETRLGWMAQATSFIPLLTAGFCPACIPPLAALFSALGIGMFAQERAVNWIFFGAIILTLFGLLLSYIKVHRNPCPMIAGVVVSGFIVATRLWHFPHLASSFLLYGGSIVLVLISFWNMRTKKPSPCSSSKWDCISCLLPKRRTPC